jgi:glutaredoxin
MQTLEITLVPDLKPPPPGGNVAEVILDKKRRATAEPLPDGDDELSAPVNEIVVANKKPGPSDGSPTSATISTTVAASGNDAGSALSNSTTSTHGKPDKYAELKKSLKQHKTPRSAKKQRKQKRALPKPGDGKYNKIYTTATADGSIIFFCVHKKKANEYAFTKNIDDILNGNPNVRETMGIDNIFQKVDPDNGDEPYSVEYINKDKESRTKFATIYHRKPSGESTKAKREKWARRVLVKYFNKYGSAQYAPKEWGAEKFEYGGDLQTSKWTDYLSDYITNASVASVMKEDLAFGDKPLKCEEMAENTMLVEMYYGPDKIEEGKRALLALGKGNTFTTGSDLESNGNPYESEDDEECDGAEENDEEASN